MAYVVNASSARSAATGKAVRASPPAARLGDRSEILERIRFEVLSPRGADRNRIVKALADSDRFDATDPRRIANGRRVTELRAMAGEVVDKTLAAGFVSLADELDSATKAQAAAAGVDDLFRSLARQCRNLHKMVDETSGRTVPLKLNKSADAVDRWLALSADMNAVTARTKALGTNPGTARLAKARDYRRLAADVDDRTLAQGYIAIAEQLESTITEGI